jgi:sugar lactone lactonase YvrE
MIIKMPDASSFIAQKVANTVAVSNRVSAKTHSTMGSIQKKLQRHGDAYPKDSPISEVYVEGTFKYTSGVYEPGGDYTLLKEALADEYGVTTNKVKLDVTGGSIVINYRIAGAPTKDPPPQGIIAAFNAILVGYGGTILRLTFANNNTECEYVITALPGTFGSGILTTPGVTTQGGYINISSLAINYTTPGIYKYTIPPGYYSMRIILGGGGGAGTPSLLSNNGTIKNIGVYGSSGGLISFHLLTADYVGKEITINVGAGGIGYSFDVSKNSSTDRIAMGSPGKHSSIELDGKTIVIAQGANSNYMDVSIDNNNIGYSVYSFGELAKNYLGIKSDINSSSLASNGGFEGPGFNEINTSIPNQPLWWPANNVGNIGNRPNMVYDSTKNNGGNGYCSILFNKIVTNVIPLPPQIRYNLNTPDFEYTYSTRGDYMIPVPPNYKTAMIAISGGRGGDGYVGPLTNIFSGQGQGYFISFEIPTKLLGERLNCRVGAGGLGGRNYSIVNGTKYKSSTITGGGGEDTVLTSSNGFAITAGGGKDNECIITSERPIPKSAEAFAEDGELGHGVEARAGYARLKYTIVNGLVTELFLNFYVNSRKTGTAISDDTNNPVIQVFRGDGTLVLSEGSTGDKNMIINSKTFRISVSVNASNNWGDQATARDSWTYTIDKVSCNPRRSPNTIYKIAGETPVRYNKFIQLDVQPLGPVEPFNEGWAPGADIDKMNVEFGYNGSDGVLRIAFTEYIPFVSNPPIKIIISGDYKSITARYLDQNNNDITSTIDNNRSLWIYSNDPEFGRNLGGPTSTDNYAYGSEFSLKKPSKITYFMYDSYYDVRSNYLDVTIPKIGSIKVTNVMLTREYLLIPVGNGYSTQTFTYDGQPSINDVGNLVRDTFSIVIFPVDVYGNIITGINILPGVSGVVRCVYRFEGNYVTQTVTKSQTFDLTNGAFTFSLQLVDGSMRIGHYDSIDLFITVNNIIYSYNMFQRIPGTETRFKYGGPYQNPSVSPTSSITDEFISYSLVPPLPTTTTTTRPVPGSTYTSSVVAAGVSDPSQLAVTGFENNIYIGNTSANIMMYDSTAGTIEAGRFPGNSYGKPTGIALDNSGNIYVADSVNSSIIRTNLYIADTTLIVNDTQIIKFPQAIAVSADNIVYVANTFYNKITKINSLGDISNFIVGLSSPAGIAVDSAGNVYVADTGNNTVKKYNPYGIIMVTISDFNAPQGVTVDNYDNIYVADTNNNQVKKYNSNGNIITTVSGFNKPKGIVVDINGNVYVSNYGDNKLLKLTPE